MNDATREYLRMQSEQPPADLAAVLAADVTTARPIPSEALRGYLTTCPNLWGVFLQYRAGVLPDVLAEFRVPFATLDYVLRDLSSVDTTNAANAAQAAQMLGGFQQAGLLTQEEVDGFLALGGGYRYDRLSAAEVQSALASFVLHADAEALLNRIANAGNAATGLVNVAVQNGGPLPDWTKVVAAFEGA